MFTLSFCWSAGIYGFVLWLPTEPQAMEAEREAPGIAFYRNYQPDIPPFAFDAELLEHVFYNLLINAAQARPMISFSST